MIIAGYISDEDIAANSIMITVLTLLWHVPNSIGMGASTKVGNAVGAQNKTKASIISRISICLGISCETCLAFIIYCTRSYWPLIFTDSDVVLDIIVKTVPIICIFIVFDSTQTVIGGILRGCGKQIIGAATYLISYYCIGMVSGVSILIFTDLGVTSLWFGLLFAAMTNFTIVGSYYSFVLNWDSILEYARIRQQNASEILEEAENEELLENTSSTEIELTEYITTEDEHNVDAI